MRILSPARAYWPHQKLGLGKVRDALQIAGRNFRVRRDAQIGQHLLQAVGRHRSKFRGLANLGPQNFGKAPAQQFKDGSA